MKLSKPLMILAISIFILGNLAMYLEIIPCTNIIGLGIGYFSGAIFILGLMARTSEQIEG